MLSALFLVILPLPNTRDTCSLQPPDAVHYSLIPFYFIWDIITNSSVVWSQPSTYIRLLNESVFLQAVFNFLLLLPFGVYLRYFLRQKRYWKRAFGLGFALSLFYEVTQVTGIYGIYNCPYRIFDVDDLLLNSTGTLFGFLVAPVLLALFPSRKSVLAKAEKIQEAGFVSPFAQLLAVLVDFLVIKISWNITIGLFSTNGLWEFIYVTVGFLVVYFLVPLLWEGKTIGTAIMRFRLIEFGRGAPSWKSLLRRLIALYLPWAVVRLLQLFSTIELDMDSVLYPYHVWTTMIVFVFVFIMWAVAIVHVALILFKKGKRNFYFDYVSNIIPSRK
jgi:glycopeptide antibiotics resistance protein